MTYVIFGLKFLFLSYRMVYTIHELRVGLLDARLVKGDLIGVKM